MIHIRARSTTGSRESPIYHLVFVFTDGFIFFFFSCYFRHNSSFLVAGCCWYSRHNLSGIVLLDLRAHTDFRILIRASSSICPWRAQNAFSTKSAPVSEKLFRLLCTAQRWTRRWSPVRVRFPQSGYRIRWWTALYCTHIAVVDRMRGLLNRRGAKISQVWARVCRQSQSFLFTGPCSQSPHISLNWM